MAHPVDIQVTQRHLEPNAIDPSVALPKHIRDAAAAADALHAQVYAPQPEPPPQPDSPQPEPPPQPDPQVTAAVTDPRPSPQELAEDNWASRYNAMKGRYDAAQRQIAAMNEQMNGLAGELRATQQMVERMQSGTAVVRPQSGHHHEQLITQQDRDTYGDELIDLTQRAARAAVEPEINTLKARNQELEKRVITSDQRILFDELAGAVPNWREINASPQFNSWLRLPDVYSGQLRGKTLRAAYNSANAQRTVAIFQDFIREVRATGGELPGQPKPTQQPDPQAQPRTPAIQLETLAAPGRARPSGGGDPAPSNADKPTYTRAQIAANYANKRKGLWAGRDADWALLEADMIAAAPEGRVR